MNEQLERLIRLEKADHKVKKLENRIKIIPEMLQKLYADCQKAKDALDEAKKEKEEGEKKRREMESEVEAQKTKLSQGKSKLPELKTNREYTSLQKEMKVIEKNISKIEDEELELMEYLDGEKGIIPEKEAFFKKEEGKYAEVKKEKDLELERLQQEVKTEIEDRQTVMTSLDEETTSIYTAILDLKGKEVVIQLINDVCQACYMEVPPQFAIEVRKSIEVLTCPQCGVILYHEKKLEAQPQT